MKEYEKNWAGSFSEGTKSVGLEDEGNISLAIVKQFKRTFPYRLARIKKEKSKREKKKIF